MNEYASQKLAGPPVVRLAGASCPRPHRLGRSDKQPGSQVSSKI